jgi:8-oxo-dGTP pyrophosphatase MutT (NUDIX family)
MEPDALKVLIYATSRDRLLVFDEPDFPDVLWQVPGGTVEAGEDVAEAALREFQEETGLAPSAPLTPLAIHDYRFPLKIGGIAWHRRHYFRIELDGLHPETWLHHELTPFGGGDPIRFRFFWIDLTQAKIRLGYGMEHCLSMIA